MNRRHFLWSAAASIVSALRAAGSPMPLGYNTYCLRSLRYNDQQLLDFAVRHKLDAIFLQDSLDPRAQDPSHWPEVRKQAADLGLHLETGGGAILPKTPGAFPASVETLRKQIVRAKALGSPLVRALLASDRASLPPGSIDEHIATAVRLLQTVRSQVMDAGLKIAIEVHKDLQAWEHKQLIEAAGKDFVGIYLDTGNPVFVLEHPLTTLETLGQYALTLHLRDSIVYEHKRGVAVQWVPLGEGVVDFQQILARARELCPHVFVYIKPITGRPPHVIPYLEESFWKAYPRARAGDLARFLALAKNGHPYERPVVIEDLQDRPLPEQFRAAVQFQQQDHMERSIAYAKNTLDLGIRWRA
ncbi:MAG TPA: TIM barrel protein [Bryobacteraceae bacterium]|nr:TIM barrel protein [Bryobacteraceae bacterium]